MERSACLLNLKSINLCLWAIVPGDGAGVPKLASMQADIQNRVVACGMHAAIHSYSSFAECIACPRTK